MTEPINESAPLTQERAEGSQQEVMMLVGVGDGVQRSVKAIVFEPDTNRLTGKQETTFGATIASDSIFFDQLMGCSAAGKSFEEALKNLQEDIRTRWQEISETNT